MCCCGSSLATAAPAAAVAEVLDRQGELVIANTAAPSDWYAFDIPANTVRNVGALLRLTIDGIVTNTMGVNRNFTLSVSLGGTTFYEAGVTSIPSNANPRAYVTAARFRVPSALTAALALSHQLATASLAPAVGIGLLTGSMQDDVEVGSFVLPVAWAGIVPLRVVITPDLANPAFSLTRRGATLEILQ